MSAYANPAIYIPIIIAAIAGIVYYVYSSRHKDKTAVAEAEEIIEAEDKQIIKQFPKGEPVLCHILDNVIGREYTRLLPYKYIVKAANRYGYLGRIWKEESKNVLALFKVDENEYKPIRKNKSQINAATTLYEDTQQPEVPILFDASEEKSFMEKYGVWIWWLAVMAFIGVMYVQGK